MKTKILLMFALILCNIGVYSQNKDGVCAYEIMYKIKGERYFRPPQFIPDTVIDNIGVRNIEGKVYELRVELIIRSCKGAASIKVFGENNKLLLEGTYSDAIELKEEDINIEDIETGVVGKRKFEYYEPLMNGIWKYNNCPQF